MIWVEFAEQRSRDDRAIQGESPRKLHRVPRRLTLSTSHIGTEKPPEHGREVHTGGLHAPKLEMFKFLPVPRNLQLTAGTFSRIPRRDKMVAI